VREIGEENLKKKRIYIKGWEAAQGGLLQC